jgi:LPXTG-motif cell wall-anchored protein
MMSPQNRFIAVLYAVFGAGVVAISLFGMSPQIEFAIRMLVLTAAVVLLVNALFRRDLAFVLISVGLFIETVDLSQRILIWIGTALVIGGFFLWWKRRNTVRPTIA